MLGAQKLLETFAAPLAWDDSCIHTRYHKDPTRQIYALEPCHADPTQKTLFTVYRAHNKLIYLIRDSFPRKTVRTSARARGGGGEAKAKQHASP